jgi:hypothetical protein
VRRRKVLGSLACALVLIGAFELRPFPSRITHDNFNHLRQGMTRAEVEAILGPPGVYTTGPTEVMSVLELLVRVNDSTGVNLMATEKTWRSDQVHIVVEFDSERVTWMCLASVARQDQSLGDNLLWRTKRQWQKWFP